MEHELYIVLFQIGINSLEYHLIKYFWTSYAA